MAMLYRPVKQFHWSPVWSILIGHRSGQYSLVIGLVNTRIDWSFAYPGLNIEQPGPSRPLEL